MVSFVVNTKLEALAVLQALKELEIDGKIIVKSSFLKSIKSSVFGALLFFEVLCLFGLRYFKKHKEISVVQNDVELLSTLDDSALVIDFVGVKLRSFTYVIQVLSEYGMNYVGVYGTLLSETGTNYRVITKNGSNVDLIKLSNSSIMARNSYIHTLKISILLLKKYYLIDDYFFQKNSKVLP